MREKSLPTSVSVRVNVLWTQTRSSSHYRGEAEVWCWLVSDEYFQEIVPAARPVEGAKHFQLSWRSLELGPAEVKSLLRMLWGSDRKGDSSKETDKQRWWAFLFSKHKVTLVWFFKVTVAGMVTALIKADWLCVASRGKESGFVREVWALAGDQTKGPSILPLSHWQEQRGNRPDLG